MIETKKSRSKIVGDLLLMWRVFMYQTKFWHFGCNRPFLRGGMFSLRRIKSFVFARQASPTREFSARFAVQKQNLLLVLLRLNMAAE